MFVRTACITQYCPKLYKRTPVQNYFNTSQKRQNFGQINFLARSSFFVFWRYLDDAFCQSSAVANIFRRNKLMSFKFCGFYYSVVNKLHCAAVFCTSRSLRCFLNHVGITLLTLLDKRLMNNQNKVRNSDLLLYKNSLYLCTIFQLKIRFYTSILNGIHHKFCYNWQKGKSNIRH